MVYLLSCLIKGELIVEGAHGLGLEALHFRLLMGLSGCISFALK